MKWLTKQKTMMVGIDVTHPGPTSREGSPSIAAVVASVDDNFVQVIIRLPPPRSNVDFLALQFPASLRIQRPDPNRESKEVRILFVLVFVPADRRRLPDVIRAQGYASRALACLREEEQGAPAANYGVPRWCFRWVLGITSTSP